MELNDGNRWLVPAVRGYADEAGDEITPYLTLPARLDLGDDGKWKPTEVVPQYAEIMRICESWMSFLRQSADDGKHDGDGLMLKFDFHTTAESAVKLLATNYRVGPVEVALLDLLTEQNMTAILNAACDIPGFVEIYKKNRRPQAHLPPLA